MAKRSSCFIPSSSSSSWGFSNGCYHLLFLFAMMLCRVVFLPCDGKDQPDCVQNTFLYDEFRYFNGLLKTKESFRGYFELKNVCFESSFLCFRSNWKFYNLMEDMVKAIIDRREPEVGLGITEPQGSFVELKSQEEKLTNARTGSLRSIAEESLLLESKFSEQLEADKLIFRNWKSQGTMSNLSVPKDNELLFPVVQVGTRFHEWITVHNLSQKPVLMQLVWNSDRCKFCKFPED